ncbi:MAG: acyl-CoA thioesterase [Flavobacteriales bacterium]|nr:acyl-CoA thioesterase [Flavobacteriales bacterium]
MISIQVPVAWGEQDLFGHVNNVVYFRYFETVRMHYLERIGILGSFDEDRLGVILASTTCDFRKPARWPQLLTVRTGTSQIGNTSFTMVYTITDEGGDLIAEGTSVQVMFDYRNGLKVPVPPAVREAITALRK